MGGGPVISALNERNPTKRTAKLCRNFTLKDGVLFHRQIKDGQAFHRLCVPPFLVEQILLACHDDLTAGHLGVNSTLDKIRRRYVWPKMKKRNVEFVTSCQDCQTKKKPKERPVGLMTPIRAAQPFERLGVDFLGPFPKSKAGNKYVIIAVDYFTKWVVAKATPSSKTGEVIDFFIKRIVLQHGAPSFLISDRGEGLKSNFIEELLKAMTTNHLVTTAYHPQCNGLVERFNHTFSQMMSMYVSSNHKDWDETIDFVTFGYNTSRHESTGLTPFFMFYGREAVLPIDVALGNNPNPVHCNAPNSSVQDIMTRLLNAREMVKRRMLVVQARQKLRYDSSHQQKIYNVGDIVLVYRPLRQKGKATKLLHHYHGPFKIVRRANLVNYIVEPLYGSKKIAECVHVSKLKRFNHRKTKQ